jgi:hypothetical protein
MGMDGQVHAQDAACLASSRAKDAAAAAKEQQKKIRPELSSHGRAYSKREEYPVSQRASLYLVIGKEELESRESSQN